MLIALLLACPRPVPPAPLAVVEPDPYAESVAAARYVSADAVVTDLLSLTPDSPTVMFDDAGRVRALSLTRAAYYDDPAYVPGHVFALYGETWFTAGDEVASACRGLTGDALDLRLEQLLGLPPGGGRDAFLVVYVDPADLFRPCSDPDPAISGCGIAPPMTEQDGVTTWDCSQTTDHGRWLCNNYIANYSRSDVSQQFPWTALGYTYDWSAEGPVGPAEFVAPGGTEVVFEALIAPEDLCSP